MPDKTYWENLQKTFDQLGTYLGDPMRQEEFSVRTWEHLEMASLAVLIAFVIGILASLSCWQRPKTELAMHSGANLLQTIPALALLAILFAFMGSGYWTAVVTLALYALLPIVKSCSTALAETQDDLLEAGLGMGMSKWEQLLHIQLPQGLPLIISGLRIAFVYSIGSATLAAFIGAGGLGQFIYSGLALNNAALVLLGAVPVAAMAIVIDLILGLVEKKALRWKNGRPLWGRIPTTS